MFSNADEVLKYLKDNDVKSVDVRFCDLPGVMQHFTVPVESFDADVFTTGLAFDGSSIRGFQSIHESDMMLLPDADTARIDPFRAAKTLNLQFFVHDPFTREAYSRDPRNVARKAENYLTSTGIADTCFFGAEAEFYIFDSVTFDSKINGTFYEVDSESGWWCWVTQTLSRITDEGRRIAAAAKLRSRNMTGQQRAQQETGIDLRVLSRCTHVAGLFSGMLKPTGRSAWEHLW